MKYILVVMLLSLSVFLSGCGQDHQAHRLVDGFMKQQMGMVDYDVVEWGEIDSTFHVSTDALNVMHRQGNTLVKGVPSYQKPTSKLNYLTIKYVRDVNKRDTVSQTFYLDDRLTGIVAFKNN